MVIIGIDPGINGGLTVLNELGSILHKEVMPVIDGSVDAHAITNTIGLWTFGTDDSIVVIEKVHSMPKQGVASTFKFGMGYGVLQGVCAALRLQYHLVTPQAWQKVILAGQGKKDTKDASAAFCKRNWPKEDWTKSERATKVHDGMTDAACIAEYGRRTFL